MIRCGGTEATTVGQGPPYRTRVGDILSVQEVYRDGIIDGCYSRRNDDTYQPSF
jgi:hypothetical protein